MLRRTPQRTYTLVKRYSSTVPDTSTATATTTPEQEQEHFISTSKPVDDVKIINDVDDFSKKKIVVDEFKPRYKYNLNSLPRVPSTNNINNNVLFNDMLMTGHMPLLSPVKKNHMQSSKKKNKMTVLENLDNFKKTKRVQLSKFENRSNYYNTYLNKENLKLPYNSIFCNTALNTQQHNLSMFNLPLNYLEKLTPFKLINKPGDEYYRDDLIVLSKIELEQLEIDKKLKLEKKLEREGKILDLKAFFGFK